MKFTKEVSFNIKYTKENVEKYKQVYRNINIHAHIACIYSTFIPEVRTEMC